MSTPEDKQKALEERRRLLREKARKLAQEKLEKAKAQRKAARAQGAAGSSSPSSPATADAERPAPDTQPSAAEPKAAAAPAAGGDDLEDELAALRARQAAEAEALRKKQEEEARLIIERKKEEKRRQEEEEAEKKEREHLEALKREEEERAAAQKEAERLERERALEEARLREEEERAMKQAAAAEQRRKEEEEAARVKQEEEAARVKQEEEAAMAKLAEKERARKEKEAAERKLLQRDSVEDMFEVGEMPEEAPAAAVPVATELTEEQQLIASMEKISRELGEDMGDQGGSAETSEEGDAPKSPSDPAGEATAPAASVEDVASATEPAKEESAPQKEAAKAKKKEAPRVILNLQGAEDHVEETEDDRMDLEECFGSEATKAEELEDLVNFPADDYEIVSIPVPLRTAESSVSEELVKETNGTLIRESVHVFSDNYRVVKRNYELYGGLSERPTCAEMREVEDDDKPWVAGGPEASLDPKILVDVKEDDAETDKWERLDNDRDDIFSVFPLKRESTAPTDSRKLKRPYQLSSNASIELLVEAKELRFHMGHIEPFFCRAFIFDIAKLERLSDYWHFDLSSTAHLEKLGTRRRFADPVNKSRAAIFTVDERNENIHIIVQVNKVLRPVDVDTAAEPFFKGVGMKDKEKAKLEEDVNYACERFGDYLMPFGWAGTPFFTDHGHLIVGSNTQFKLYKHKAETSPESMAETLRKQAKEGKGSAGGKKVLPAELIFSIHMLEDDDETLMSNSAIYIDSRKLRGRFNPSYLPVKPLGAGEVIREILPLRAHTTFPVPHLEYQNTLLVFLENLNLTKFKGVEARNLMVRVRLKDNDRDLNDQGLECMYGQSSEAKFLHDTRSCVVFHNKKPSMFDAIRVQLPGNLTSFHHLLFTFYHVNVEEKKGVDLECELGYTTLYLLTEQNAFIANDRYHLPIAQMHISQYNTAQETTPGFKWVDNKKPLFTISTYLASSVYAHDANLMEFFRQTHTDSDGGPLVISLRKLREVDEYYHAKFFITILNLLFRVMVTKSDTARKESFSDMLAILTSVSNKLLSDTDGERHSLLQSYVNFSFADTNEDRPVYEEIAKRWLIEAKKQSTDLGVSYRFSWFLFELIIKSIAMRNVQLKSRREAQSEEFRTNIRELLRHALLYVVQNQGGNEHAEQLNESISIFFKDLFGVMDRAFVFDLLKYHIDHIDSRNANPRLVQFKARVLEIVCDYEHFIPLNTPLYIPAVSVTQLREQYMRRYRLVGMLLTEVESTLTSSNQAIRHLMTPVLRDVLWKHDLDERFEDPYRKMRVATIYFPLLLIAVNNAQNVMSLTKEQQQDWAVSILFVLRNAYRDDITRRWWKMESIKNLVSFLNLLTTFATLFDELPTVREVSFVILDVLEDFMQDYFEELKSKESLLMPHFFEAFVSLFEKQQTVSFMTCLFRTARRVIDKFADVMFKYDNAEYCGALLYEVLRYTNQPNTITRSEAGAVTYLLIKTNFLATQHFARMKLQSMIAVSKLASKSGIKEFSKLQMTLQHVARLAKREFPVDLTGTGSLGDQVEALTTRLFAVIRDSVKINEYEFDPEMVAELQLDVARGYFESPDLRVTWLENLARFHESKGNWAEVAQCKLYLCVLVTQCLILQQQAQDTGVPKDPAQFDTMSPGVHDELGLPDPKSAGEEGLFNSNVWSEEGLVNALEEAVEALKRGQCFEVCTLVYELLLEYHQSRRDYGRLAELFSDLKKVSSDLVQANSQGRMMAEYYRVAFIGKGWNELADREYVYKEGPMVRLAEFAQRLKVQYENAYGSDKVELLGNKSISEYKPTMKDWKCYYQIVSVKPYFEEQNAAERRPTEWDRNHNVSKFIFETPFTMEGRVQGDISAQMKRKTILTITKPFPGVLKRMAVSDKQEIVLTPIENAIELITSRKDALRTELNRQPPQAKSLQINLQGAVLAQVNAGPVEIARNFLGHKSVEFAKEHVDALSTGIKEFLTVCKFALALNKSLIGPDQIDFQTECEAGYERLNSEVGELLQWATALADEF